MKKQNKIKKIALFPLRIIGFVLGYTAIILGAAFIALPFWVKDHSHPVK